MTKNILISLMLLLLISGLAAGEEENKPLTLDAKFYADIFKIPPVGRDAALESRLNSIVLGRGQIRGIEMIKRYKKAFRIVVVDQDSEKSNLKLTFYIYADSKSTHSMLKEKDLFEFSGQLVAYTPINIRRDTYVLDIILEKGVVLIQ